MKDENKRREETEVKPPSESFLNTHVKTQPRVPKGTPKAGGQFAEERKPEGGDLEETPPITKSPKAKRNDKWTPSNIDWKRLELVMIVERDFYEDENGREHSAPHDYLVKGSLPLQFEDATGRDDILDYYDVSGLDSDKSNCRCGVCGHVLKYGGVLVDFENHDGVMVGFDCLETYNAVVDGLEDARFQARRSAAIQRGETNVRKACDENEGLAEAFDAAGDHYIVSDIKARLRKYGSISEKQVALVKKIATDVAERAAKRAASDAASAAAPNAPEGKQTVRGTVLSTRVEESNFGYQTTHVLKMLVQSEEGWKVWVTAPSALVSTPIEDESGAVRYRKVDRGDEIQFDATLERSQKDPKFAYGKRPTKASFLSRGQV